MWGHRRDKLVKLGKSKTFAYVWCGGLVRTNGGSVTGDAGDIARGRAPNLQGDERACHGLCRLRARVGSPSRE